MASKKQLAQRKRFAQAVRGCRTGRKLPSRESFSECMRKKLKKGKR